MPDWVPCRMRRARQRAKLRRRYERYSKLTLHDHWLCFLAEWSARKVRHVEPRRTPISQGASR